MCIMHAPINRKTISVTKKYDRVKKMAPKPFDERLLKPDPDFVDERKKVETKPQKRGFFAKMLQ